VLWARLVSKERVFPCTLGTFSVNERLLVLWCDSYNAAERVFPCALGTFSVNERLLVLWCDSYNAAERERESISLCFGHDIVSKSVSLCFGHV
jgi:hypothetical protein